MPRFNIPHLTADIPLTDYQPGMVGATGEPAKIYVWVNPPRAMLQSHTEIVTRVKAATSGSPEWEAAINDLSAWFAEIWSQHADESTHCAPEEVREIVNSETDPRLWVWLQRRTLGLITAHREEVQKK